VGGFLSKRPRSRFVKTYTTKVACRSAPENPDTINRKQLGNLKLSDKQEDLLVAFLKTLTARYASRTSAGITACDHARPKSRVSASHREFR
jgi:hypothetical protein